MEDVIYVRETITRDVPVEYRMDIIHYTTVIFNSDNFDSDKYVVPFKIWQHIVDNTSIELRSVVRGIFLPDSKFYQPPALNYTITTTRDAKLINDLLNREDISHEDEVFYELWLGGQVSGTAQGSSYEKDEDID